MIITVFHSLYLAHKTVLPHYTVCKSVYYILHTKNEMCQTLRHILHDVHVGCRLSDRRWSHVKDRCGKLAVKLPQVLTVPQH